MPPRKRRADKDGGQRQRQRQAVAELDPTVPAEQQEHAAAIVPAAAAAAAAAAAYLEHPGGPAALAVLGIMQPHAAGAATAAPGDLGPPLLQPALPPPPPAAVVAADRKAAARERNRLRQQQRRAGQSKSQKQRERDLNKQRMEASRNGRTPAQRAEDNAVHAQQEAARVAALTEEQRQQHNAVHSQHEAARVAALTEASRLFGCFEAVSRLLQDIMGAENPALRGVPFGGKVVCLCGDYRQIAPVISKGSRAQVEAACLTRSPLWRHVRLFRLVTNMRVQRLLAEGRDPARQQWFSNMLLDLGEGRGGVGPDGDLWQVPQHMLAPTQSPKDLISSIFGDLTLGQALGDIFTDRAILAPKNDDVAAINSEATALWPGEQRNYSSADCMPAGEEGAAVYPPEFLNSLDVQGLPPHLLTLKVGMPIILLRNLSPSLGLTNGTRLKVLQLRDRVIRAQILTGRHAGQAVLIPRCSITPSDSNLPFTFTRRQFPVRPAFAMTINKSQGQTFKKVGIYLPSPVFSHGQLYVAVSRVGEESGVTIVVAHPALVGATEGSTCTRNIVFTGILRAMDEAAG